MRLNIQTDYALRLMMHLAVKRDGLVSAAETANLFGVSKSHLMKVASALVRAGYVESVRGRSGGLRLSPEGFAVSVGDVVRLMEGDLDVVECFQKGGGECLISPACKLRGALHRALEAFLTVLDQYTVDDLTANNAKLFSLLDGEAA
ncbi:RrF2 family transcriptional regulator [Hyphobacterium marinum]|uniref:Rrf2 family transcriptional regulator n=1 Tax=Hyphobacterium marinum TaxID=3116574 RepID=A0ABU7LVT5_9PROT|nr:Rrf2 family transcriptional regulator [Hyphobacterium sp. Y6023]MEE2565662.1 Rrf2 family transcriptional regulator [Hyphobacterium sp. Y6023]